MSDPQIYVRGFSKNCKESDLKELFNKFGNIKQVRIIRDYAFIVFNSKDEIENAVKEMDGEIYQDYKLRVQVAGKPRRLKGPQPNDECRYCRKLGHWQNDCPQYREKKRRRRRHRSYSSSSSSSSSDSQRSRRRRKDKKIKKKNRKRSYSSSSSSSSDSSSRSSSIESKNRRSNQQEKNDK